MDNNNKRYTVLFFSKKFSKPLINSLTSFEKEILAIIGSLSLPSVTYYLGQAMKDLIIESDCSALLCLVAQAKCNNPKLIRWVNKITSLGLPVKFRHKINDSCINGPDYLSRMWDNKVEEPKILRDSIKNTRKSQVTIPEELLKADTYTIKQVEELLDKNPYYVRNIIEESDLKITKKLKSPKLIETLDVLKVTESPPVIEELRQLALRHDQLRKYRIKHANSIIEDWPTDTIGQVHGCFKNITGTKIAKMQSEDPNLQKIISEILTKTDKSSSRYRLLNGCILVRLKDKMNKNLKLTNIAIVLNTLVACNIIGLMHVLSHSGTNSTIRMFRRLYYCKGITKIVKNICLCCKICQLARKSNIGVIAGRINVSTQILHTIAIDHSFLDNQIYEGKRYIGFLMIVCESSKYCLAQPVRTTKVIETLNILRDVFANFGSQIKLVISDQHSALCKNEKIKSLCEQYGIKCRTGLGYNSQSNAICERFNQKLKYLLKTMSTMTGTTWIEVFHLCKRIMNELPAGKLGDKAISPYEIVFKKPPQITNNILDNFCDAELTEKRKENLANKIELFMKNEKEKSLEEYNERLKSDKLKKMVVGSIVLKQILGDKVNKNNLVYEPRLYIVVDRNHLEVSIQKFDDSNDQNIVKCHIKFLKLFHHKHIEYFKYLQSSIRGLLGYKNDKNSDDLKHLDTNFNFNEATNSLTKNSINLNFLPSENSNSEDSDISTSDLSGSKDDGMMVTKEYDEQTNLIKSAKNYQKTEITYPESECVSENTISYSEKNRELDSWIDDQIKYSKSQIPKSDNPKDILTSSPNTSKWAKNQLAKLRKIFKSPTIKRNKPEDKQTKIIIKNDPELIRKFRKTTPTNYEDELLSRDSKLDEHSIRKESLRRRKKLDYKHFNKTGIKRYL